MLTIKNIDKLIGHEFTKLHTERNWEVIDILPYHNENRYSIKLGKFITIYDPNSFSPVKRIIETNTIILDRIQRDGKYTMWNGDDKINNLAMDISLMDTKEKLIAAIEFIL
jgi:hypothetical protein